MSDFFPIIQDVIIDAAILSCALALLSRLVRSLVNVVSGKGLFI